MFTCKHNQPGLFAALDALPWTRAPIADRDIDTDHGRITTRTIQVLPAPPELPFPHVNQAWLIERYVTDPTGKPLSAIAAMGVTNLTTDRVTPPDSPRWSATTGASNRCTGCATPSTARTTPPSTPDQDPVSWPPCATSPSAHTT